MNKELYVSSTPHETKVALVEDDQLAEVFFERDNEYTLAGSIYKGRVTRVLPGMQSAFVEIGLERDAFLYVSDFLELSDEEDSEEFGDIPTPHTTVNLSPQSPNAGVQAAIADLPVDEEAEFLAAVEGVAPVETDDEAEVEESSASPGGDQNSGDGARRWRGRRRRGGRRGGRDERPERLEPKVEAATAEEPPVEAVEPIIEAPVEHRPQPRSDSRYEPRQDTRSNSRRDSRSRSDFGPRPGYTPMVLPGESISKYRNLPTQPAAEAVVATEEPETTSELVETVAAVPVEDFVAPAESQPVEEAVFAATEKVVEPPVEQDQFTVAAPEAVVALEQPAETEPAAAPEPEIQATREPTYAAHKQVAAAPVIEAPEHPAHVEAAEYGTIEVVSDATEEEPSNSETGTESQFTSGFQQHSAPSEAPEGRTLEHETLEDDEMEFHPMPENIEALSEVAGDLELEMEEETLDSNDGYSDRWIPKIADVDEDEVVAAEERGETRFAAAEEEEEDEEDAGEEETNGRAELRAAPPTAGYQQRQSERQGFNRRNDRGRRGGGSGGRRNNVRTGAHSHRPQPLISDLLKEGQEILVQIAKEPIGKKGARITSHIALPGRFLVYMPTVNHTGVSRKINSEEERQRLKRIVTSERENGLGGFIVRTAAANIKEDELRADIRFLKHLWAEIKSRADSGKSPALIYHDLNLVERVLRDQVNADFSQIWVDTEEEYERVVRFAQRFQPSLVRRIKLYTKTTPLYEHFGIQDEINNALKSKVWLKSGGYIVINQTEALVAIDINTGKYVGKTQRLEDTIVKTNVDAIKEIVRQIRLRDLGGIIVIDFIDMDERKNRQKVMQALEEALRSDRAPSKVLQFNDFGLVAITRKRVKQSLERTLGESCPYCVGAGFVKSVPTVCNEIYIEMRKMIHEHDRTDITLRVNPEVAKVLKANNGKLITEMEELTGKTILVKSDALLHQENFDMQ
ncbi:MAG TPA: Rne/Rng family ribonuclease [Terriglobales bacterium]